MIGEWSLTVGGYVLSAILLGFYVGAREDLAAEIERCNTDKIAAVQEATEALRIAREGALKARIEELEGFLIEESNARKIAEEAALAASGRSDRVRTVIKEVMNENECLNSAIPTPILDSLR